jgi:hypothetical protein
MKNGKIKYIKEILLGDVLENGAYVDTIIKIDNKREKMPMHVIENAGVNSQDIFVAGSHIVFDKERNKFIKTENYGRAYKSDVKLDWFSCLITSNHNIKIGSELFLDWQGYSVKNENISYIWL